MHLLGFDIWIHVYCAYYGLYTTPGEILLRFSSSYILVSKVCASLPCLSDVWRANVRLSQHLTSHLFKGFCQLVAMQGGIERKRSPQEPVCPGHVSSTHWSVNLQATCPAEAVDANKPILFRQRHPEWITILFWLNRKCVQIHNQENCGHAVVWCTVKS